MNLQAARGGNVSPVTGLFLFLMKLLLLGLGAGNRKQIWQLKLAGNDVIN